jgi:hypothetical protein
MPRAASTLTSSWRGVEHASALADVVEPYLDPDTGPLRHLVGARTHDALDLAEADLTHNRGFKVLVRPVRVTGVLDARGVAFPAPGLLGEGSQAPAVSLPRGLTASIRAVIDDRRLVGPSLIALPRFSAPNEPGERVADDNDAEDSNEPLPGDDPNQESRTQLAQPDREHGKHVVDREDTSAQIRWRLGLQPIVTQRRGCAPADVRNDYKTYCERAQRLQ